VKRLFLFGHNETSLTKNDQKLVAPMLAQHDCGETTKLNEKRKRTGGFVSYFFTASPFAREHEGLEETQRRRPMSRYGATYWHEVSHMARISGPTGSTLPREP
jgi:hypothetical protein